MFVWTTCWVWSIALAAPQTVHDVEGATVEVGTPIRIQRSEKERHWFPHVAQMDPKRLTVTMSRAPDEINPQPVPSIYQITEDGGRTWAPPRIWPESGNSWTRLKDGTALWLSYLLTYQDETVARCRVGRSMDGVNYTWSDGTVYVAPNRFDHWEKGTASFVFHRAILERPDGGLLATMYGRFVGDASYRSILVRSTDGGTSWKWLSTIAYDPDIKGEGPCEPDLVQLADGDLFCMMRVNSAAPMYWTRSTDEGRSWCTPVRMPEEYAALSVDPDLLLLSNGMLACSAGRPNCHLMLSLDGKGTEWTRPVPVFLGPTTSYTSIVEVAPGEILYVHDVTSSGWESPKEGQFHEVRAVPVSIKLNR